MDDIIQKAHLDREIDRRLDGVETVFDGGAGAGRFTIPLARRGLQVTHFDISRSMVTKARELAAKAGVADRIDFVIGRLTNLQQYNDGQFDMVVSFDAPISYTYPQQFEVIRELVRIARKTVIVSVASRYGSMPYLFNPAQKQQYLVDPDSQDPILQWYPRPSEEMVTGWRPDFQLMDQFIRTGLFQDPDEVYNQMERGQAPWPVDYAFTPDDLQRALEGAGLHQ